jgi:U3 small nucleolar RNA-associated protein 10
MICNVLRIISKIIASPSEKAMIVSGLNALTAINVTLSTGEEGAATELVPIILSAVQQRQAVQEALAALVPLPFVVVSHSPNTIFMLFHRAKLGPRIIPYFRDMISQIVSVLREAADGEQLSFPGDISSLLVLQMFPKLRLVFCVL